MRSILRLEDMRILSMVREGILLVAYCLFVSMLVGHKKHNTMQTIDTWYYDMTIIYVMM